MFAACPTGSYPGDPSLPLRQLLRRQMRNGIDMNFKRSREATKILASFQQRCQRESDEHRCGQFPDESLVGFAYAVWVIQFLSCQFFTRTWLGGTVDGCHRVSRKRVRRSSLMERLF